MLQRFHTLFNLPSGSWWSPIIIKVLDKVNGKPCQYCGNVIQIEKDILLSIELLGVNLLMLGHHHLRNAATAVCAALCLHHQAYSASKFGLCGLVEALQQEVIADDIHVSLIFPPDTDTPGLVEDSIGRTWMTFVVTSGGTFDLILATLEDWVLLNPTRLAKMMFCPVLRLPGCLILLVP